MHTTIRKPSDAQVARAALNRISAGRPFARPVSLTAKQLTQFGKGLERLAQKNPQRAADLLQRTMDLYGQGKVSVKDPAPLSYGGRNDMAEMADGVIAAIRKADPNVMTPAPMVMAK